MSSPLADRLRPQTIEEMVGQKHLLGQGMALCNIIKSGYLPNLIFYGPSGTGKTTLAKIIAKDTNKRLFCINGTNASLADVRSVIKEIDEENDNSDGILLYLDEIQYFNKKQQQSLLEFIENGQITLIASTTENPYFYVYNAVLSRCTVFEFKVVSPEDIKPAIERAYKFVEDESKCEIKTNDEIIEHIAVSSGGDVRKALNFVELSVLSTPLKDNIKTISLENISSITAKNAFKYDRAGDDHYDVISAFQKSMRGSDPDAAIHYLARLIEAGDLPSITRRLMVCACEDVGLAYPQVIPIVKSACDIAMQVGLPEAALPLADAVILVATSPKSNSAYTAIQMALKAVQSGRYGNIPRHLQNTHFDGVDSKAKGQNYLYPHNYQNSWVKQQYLPDSIKDVEYYHPGNNKIEKLTEEYWKKIKK